ncbi:hypothetical protein MNEG_15050 [Monoraphidium neglectum]|uniref:Uncharacterized protein n=1 Tax=Monoraphidium neglectum TaxID=145388 RepID=A0A0D2IY95_9CHLO|nr:hypothetical protein MNEG_15050 [Monoraphidium neglectum]KIY92912.1 hypothetical protein MNEG_15050 [Monoraphidium neglectum]|eukprot:XP_013891932.1 hypothetical protein MNEG_15050 [Monoraphidium neglectum]
MSSTLSASGRLAALAVPPAAGHGPCPGKLAVNTPAGSKPNKFAVYDLDEDRNEAPKTFHDAAERGNTAWCVRAIERTIDFDVNCRDRLMRTALHWAAEMGHHETAKTLLDFGVDVRTSDCTGRC